MQAPAFWSRPADRPGIAARLLWPLTLAWRAGAWLRRVRARPWAAPVPVLCVGNLTAGGAGKTPLVMALAGRLAGRGVAVHILSRGHGGRLAGPHRVDPAADAAADVGDEPLLLAHAAPVWIARDRAAAARAAVAAGAEFLLMDDGFQNPALVQDAAVLAVDAGAGFGNGRLIPAGPLREPAGPGLARADAVVLIGPEAARAAALARWPALAARAPVAAELVPAATGLDLAGLPVLAFAGIGRPAKFFETLAAQGARIVGAEPFPDHHRYPRAVLERLLRRARAAGAMLVTTEKDAVRLPARFRREVMVLVVRLEPRDWAPLDAAIARAGHAAARRAGGGPQGAIKST